jgi:hypothetical protein
MTYYLTVCRKCHAQWPDGELRTGMLANTQRMHCDGCGKVADVLAMAAYEPESDYVKVWKNENL